jgi:hypothetical protein
MKKTPGLHAHQLQVWPESAHTPLPHSSSASLKYTQSTLELNAEVYCRVTQATHLSKKLRMTVFPSETLDASVETSNQLGGPDHDPTTVYPKICRNGHCRR